MNRKSLKAVIFDFGNVICKFDNNIFLKKISRFSDKSVQELSELIYSSPDNLPRKYETGLITSDEFFNAVKEKCNLSISKEDFIEAYTKIFTPIPETFDLIKKLKSEGYKLALLSNTSEWDFEYGIKPIEVFNLFDAVSLSFEVKAMKPEKRIFYDSLEKLNLKPEECVYIDDIKEYVDVADEIGIKGIHYTSPSQLKASLIELKILSEK